MSDSAFHTVNNSLDVRLSQNIKMLREQRDLYGIKFQWSERRIKRRQLALAAKLCEEARKEFPNAPNLERKLADFERSVWWALETEAYLPYTRPAPM